MKRILLIAIGTISLGLGVVGIVLPILPTTPFLLITLACYLKSSTALYHFVLENKHLSPYIKDYASGNGIPVKAKKKAILLIWLSIGFSVLFVINQMFFKIMLVTIASIVSTYIWTRKTPDQKHAVNTIDR